MEVDVIMFGRRCQQRRPYLFLAEDGRDGSTYGREEASNKRFYIWLLCPGVNKFFDPYLYATIIHNN